MPNHLEITDHEREEFTRDLNALVASFVALATKHQKFMRLSKDPSLNPAVAKLVGEEFDRIDMLVDELETKLR